MAERRRIVEELPEHIIQRIQSFLTGKAAAQTSVLSKSWRKAWLTRPNIDFDRGECEDCRPKYIERYPHCQNCRNNEFLELVNKTIQRYEESNLKIDCFRLRLRSLRCDEFDPANTLILKALKLCAHHLCFGIRNGGGGFVISREVFESENLLGLSAEGCEIDIGMDHNVRCSKLQSLSFNLDAIKYPGVVFKLISSCPLIENLSLSSSENLSLSSSVNRSSVNRSPINLPEMHNLKRLVLSGVTLDTLFFRDMSSKFPSLKDLTLENLSVGGCTFDEGMDQIVRCSTLQSLSVDSLRTESRDVISKIILSCPLIDNMSLSQICEGKTCVPLRRSGPIRLPELHNIKCLVLLCFWEFDTLFFYDSSSKFPFLKDLTLNVFRPDQKEIQISSHSLEHLNILATEFWTRNMMFELDVPSIRKFTFEGRFIPLVSFKPTSREWESHVSINYMDADPIGTLWFLVLNELLTALIPSKIYLSINGRSKMCFDYKVGDIQGLPQPEVENLTVDILYLQTLNYALSDGIFRACRPKFVTQHPGCYSDGKTNSDFLCKTLALGVNGEFSSPRNFMYGLNGLKEVNVQVFDEFVAAWKDVPCKSLLEASENPQEKKNIRFQLLWKP